jgi:uncharacterized damage-inducible protein DinB
MQETPKEYQQRLLGNVAGQKPEKIQAESAKKIEKLIRGVPASRLTKQPAPGKWSVAQILAHLADSEIVAAWRMRAVLGAPGTPIQAYDQDAWAAVLNYAKRPAKESLAAFRAARECNLAMLKALPREKWLLSGIHAERGEESVATIVSLMAGHDINHIRQIETILKPKTRKK